MKPEELARLSIDQQLKDAGWTVVERNAFNPQDSAVAVCEELLQDNNRADYLLVLYGKAVGVIEAKRKGVDLRSPAVIAQAERYTHMLRPQFPCWESPLPFIFISNGQEILAKDAYLSDNTSFVPVLRFPRPYELCSRVSAINNKVFNEFQLLPPLERKGLRECQYEAITSFEASLKCGHRRALLVQATGAGKTRTACAIVHRLVKYSSSVRRVLFLVDRSNLAQAALLAFNTFEDEQHVPVFVNSLGVATLSESAQFNDVNTVLVSTIQLLYFIIGGALSDETCSNFDEDMSKVDSCGCEAAIDDSFDSAPIILPNNIQLRPDYFDLIIIDECHRSIYTKWRPVLEYFANHAIMLGLTATPIAETMEFFHNNVVSQYSFVQSVVDGINVPPVVYRIDTQLTRSGGQILAGETIHVGSHVFGNEQVKRAVTPVFYQGRDVQHSRAIMVPAQIYAVLQEYKNVVFTKLYPEREPNFAFLPKTLIFTQNERHAKLVEEICRDVFAVPASDQSFVQRITFKAGNSFARINAFRLQTACRIAITVTLISTGTDIPAVEILLFLTDIHSQVLYQQMKGRGVRYISDDSLREVTPNAEHKDHFVIIDAVGVTKSDKLVPQVVNNGTKRAYKSLEQVLEELSRGLLSDDNMMLLAQKICTLSNRGDKDELLELKKVAPLLDLSRLGQDIFTSLEQQLIPPFINSNEDNIERKALLSVLLTNVRARRKLIEISHGYFKLLPQQHDSVVLSGFMPNESEVRLKMLDKTLKQLADDEPLFQAYKDDALQMSDMSFKQLNRVQRILLQHDPFFEVSRLWADCAALYMSITEADTDRVVDCSVTYGAKVVVALTSKNELQAVTNIVPLLRFMFHHSTRLESWAQPVRFERLFQLWCNNNCSKFPMANEDLSLYRTLALQIVTGGALVNLQSLYAVNHLLCWHLPKHFREQSDLASSVFQSLSACLIWEK